MSIPFVDLHAQYLSIKTDIDAAISSVIAESSYIGGTHVKRFEEAYAADYGVKNCVSVANGTDAIYIVLKMLGIGEGDEVITTAHSWISTTETISQAGATPVFVDVDDFYLLDADLIEKAITPRTKLIIPVHLYGHAVNMTKVMDIAAKHKLFVMEDCAQAHYATWQGKRVGTFGNAATFSFFPGKNLGAYGDAGAILTNDDELAVKMKMFANHGQLKKHTHKLEGINSRLDGMQAAILNAKLPHIHEWTRERQQVAAWYDELLQDVKGVTLPKVQPGASHVYHLYVIQVDKREKLMQDLLAAGINTAVHYPTALPLLEVYAYLGIKTEQFPNAKRNQDRILSLPIYPELDRNTVKMIATEIDKSINNLH
jgi:dTDP-4-amino-4,6-dideoxygalactose transaminase